MFERFTDRARRVLVLAQDEARAMEHNFLGTEHLLLGMIKEGEGVAAKALVELGVEHAALRERVLAVIPLGPPGAASGAPPFTPRSKHVLELALREALDMNHNYIGTEHLLLGLLREGSGVASQVLVAAGLDATSVRAKVISLLTGYQASTAPMGRTTPAGGMLGTRAKALAGTEPVGSHHFLLGILEDPTSLGGRILGSLGVTREAVAARVKEIGVDGTTDEMATPKTSGTRPFTFEFGPGVSLQVADVELAKKIAATLAGAGSLQVGADDAGMAALVGSIVADAIGAVAPEPAVAEDNEDDPGEDAAPPG